MKPVHPFLKWPGSKWAISETIRQHLPDGGRLVEPFVGSGAMFLNTGYPRYLLADASPDLIALYNALVSDPDEFIADSRELFVPANNDKEAYLALRSKFNALVPGWERSVIFVYLNRHCFNGLVRYNLKGQFNTPFGAYDQPYFPEKEMRFFAEKAGDVELACADFVDALEMVEEGDVVYCDPPYVPLSPSASFTAYAAGGFGMREQQVLAATAKDLASKGIPVVISNSDTKISRKLYAGAEIISLRVRRSIGASAATRKSVGEILAVFDGRN